MSTKPLASVPKEIPIKIAPSEYDKLMRELWEIRQIMANYQMDQKLRDQVDYLATEIIAVRKENSLIKKMLINIGTAIFKKGIK